MRRLGNKQKHFSQMPPPLKAPSSSLSISSFLPPALGWFSVNLSLHLPPSSVRSAAIVTTATLHEVHLQKIGGRE